MGGCCGQSAASSLAAQRATEKAPEQEYVNYYPDGSNETTTGEANAQARQRAKGGTYRLK